MAEAVCEGAPGHRSLAIIDHWLWMSGKFRVQSVASKKSDAKVMPWQLLWHLEEQTIISISRWCGCQNPQRLCQLRRHRWRCMAFAALSQHDQWFFNHVCSVHRLLWNQVVCINACVINHNPQTMGQPTRAWTIKGSSGGRVESWSVVRGVVVVVAT